MSKRNKTLKHLADIIKPYGLTIVEGSQHRKVLNERGQAVYHMSSSPSCAFFAERSLKDLIRIGLVPEFEKQKIR